MKSFFSISSKLSTPLDYNIAQLNTLFLAICSSIPEDTALASKKLSFDSDSNVQRTRLGTWFKLATNLVYALTKPLATHEQKLSYCYTPLAGRGIVESVE